MDLQTLSDREVVFQNVSVFSVHALLGRALAAVFLFAAPHLHSSAHAEGLSQWEAMQPPRARIGACPHPSPFRLVLPTGVSFGRHSYRSFINAWGFMPSEETSRGHFYTRHGGFIDLAHLRRSIDLTAFVHARVKQAMRAGDTHFSFWGTERTMHHCYLSYPESWHQLGDERREEIIEELSIAIGHRAGFDIGTWREILTWFGYSSLVIDPERDSAFSFEDIPSHAIGAAIAIRALRTPGVPFDDAVTAEMARELRQLVPLSEEVYHRAIKMIEGKWWPAATTSKRLLSAGMDGKPIRPWLVPGLEREVDPQPRVYPAPPTDFSDIAGYDCTGMIKFEYAPLPVVGRKALAVAGTRTARIDPARDYPKIIAQIEREMAREFGPHFARPDR